MTVEYFFPPTAAGYSSFVSNLYDQSLPIYKAIGVSEETMTRLKNLRDVLKFFDDLITKATTLRSDCVSNRNVLIFDHNRTTLPNRFLVRTRTAGGQLQPVVSRQG